MANIFAYCIEGHRHRVYKKGDEIPMKVQKDTWSDSYGSYEAYAHYFPISEPGLYVVYYPHPSDSSRTNFALFSIHDLTKQHTPSGQISKDDKNRYYNTYKPRSTVLSNIILVGTGETAPSGITCYQIMNY